MKIATLLTFVALGLAACVLDDDQGRGGGWHDGRGGGGWHDGRSGDWRGGGGDWRGGAYENRGYENRGYENHWR